MRFIKTFLALSLLLSTHAFAAEVVIEDSTGVIRNVSDLQTSAKIRFSVSEAKGGNGNGSVVNLVSKDGLLKFQATCVDGVAEFSNIPAGHWVVSSENSQLLFTQINVTEYTATVAGLDGGTAIGVSSPGTGLTTAGVAGVGVLAAGGITGLVLSITESDSNDKTELSPSS